MGKENGRPPQATFVTAHSVIQVRLVWGMPITIHITDLGDDFSFRNAEAVIERVFRYFEAVDAKFSPYQPVSEISLINQGLLSIEEASLEMRTVIDLAEAMRLETGGYFNIYQNGIYDPSGLVKGWAVSNAGVMIQEAGYGNFYVEAGGDFQAVGKNPYGQDWRVGIRNPFAIGEIVKVLRISNRGVATSGIYIRGNHIYNPVEGGPINDEILSITVMGPDVYEADCYATSALAMGKNGISFIESLDGFEGYMIDKDQVATFTTGFKRFIDHAAC